MIITGLNVLSWTFSPCFIYNSNYCRMSRAGGKSACGNWAGLAYSGNLPSYMMLSSPHTCPQFLIGMDHFFVASNVDRYNAFKSAVSLGNTLL